MIVINQAERSARESDRAVVPTIREFVLALYALVDSRTYQGSLVQALSRQDCRAQHTVLALRLIEVCLRLQFRWRRRGTATDEALWPGCLMGQSEHWPAAFLCSESLCGRSASGCRCAWHGHVHQGRLSPFQCTWICPRTRVKAASSSCCILCKSETAVPGGKRHPCRLWPGVQAIDADCTQPLLWKAPSSPASLNSL